MTTSSADEFPFADIIPKNETNVLSFLQKHPNYDGRGVKIGILDTGVDPNAFGLSTTTDGSCKLVDTIDCTGSGDVNVSNEIQIKLIQEEEVKDDKAYSYWEVTGLSGRTIKLNPALDLQNFPESHTSSSKPKDDNKEDKEEDEVDNSSDNDSKIVSPRKKVIKEGQVRLGIKPAYELFPTRLVKRVKEYRLSTFEKEINGKILKLKQELVEWESSLGGGNKNKPSHDETRVRDDIQNKIDILQESISNFLSDDPGPIYDCIVYYDGTNYRCVIADGSNDEAGKAIEIKKGMTDYRKEKQWSTFSIIDQYNYAVNFYDEGTVLSIVCDAGAHGSHVAGIAASYYHNDDSSSNDNDEFSLLRSGVAPGAQVISFKIGDTRLGSMETGTSLVRALIMAIKLKCDVINLSYGEGCVVPNTGHFVKLLNDFVYKHNIVFVSSAGNNGPALSTVGAPGGTSSAIIGVSAYVSNAMMKTEYSMISENSKNINTDGKEGGSNERDDTTTNDLSGSTYTWSSVGPAVDGDIGVNITSPGGAITSVPNWTLQRTQLMNGTSMSSPHATGCVALLLSACKQNSITDVTPTKIKRALENTAKFLPNLSKLQQGCGMIQVDKAWEYIVDNYSNTKGTSSLSYDYDDVYFNVSIDNRPNKQRGIYLRQMQEIKSKQTISINIKPNFGTIDDVSDEIQKCRINYEGHFHLHVSTIEYNNNITSGDGNSQCSWLSIPEHFVVMHNGRSFKVDIDATKLWDQPGVHTAKIVGIDSQNPDKGAMFSVPVTVIIPININDTASSDPSSITLGELDFEASEVKRFFVDVPDGCTWMDVTLRDCRTDSKDKDSSSRLFVLHTIQLLQNAAYRDNEGHKYFNLLPGQSTVTSIAVHPGITCEIDLARYWSALGVTKVHASIKFHGILPKPVALQMICSGGGGAKVRLSSSINDEMINPVAKLSKWKTPLRPTLPSGISVSSLISPLGERDILPTSKKRIYQLVLTYEFSQEESGSLVIRAPALQGVLYESAYESQLILIFDGDKKYLGVNDAWPDEVKVPKGSTIIRIQIRHYDTSMLEKLKEMVIWIERKLEKEISLVAYNTKEDMMIGKDPIKKRTLRKGTSASVFFAEPAHSKLPKQVKCGDVLFGTISYGAADESLPGTGKRPGGYVISFVVGPKPAEDKSKDGGVTPEVPDERSIQEKLDEAVRDLKIEQLGKLSSKEKEDGKFEELFNAFEKEYSHHIPLLMSSLKYFDAKTPREESLLQKIIDAANKVIAEISEDELALHFGKNHDKEDPKSCKERKTMDEKKSFLIEAMGRKARAVAEINDKSSSGEDFDAILKQLNCWTDIDSNHKYAILVLEKEKRAGRYGTMLKLLNTLLKNNGDDTKGGTCPLTKSDLLKRRAEVFEQLGYTSLVEYDMMRSCISKPKNYMPF